jgi:anthranilate phosphoribosyltransferase
MDIPVGVACPRQHGFERPGIVGRIAATQLLGRAQRVHGSDGLDEITVTGPTRVVALEDGRITRFTIDPRLH